VAEEFANLLAQGIDVFHLCDSEFNIPYRHAKGICEELIRRGLGQRMRWYTYMAVTPFDAELADLMRRAGCRGINFTGDSGCEAMLRAYRHEYGREDLASAVRWCKEAGIAVMPDMLIGGPGETPKTAAESIEFFKRIDPDCAGAALGIRVYPGTAIAEHVIGEGFNRANGNLHFRYEGKEDLFRPTFYLAQELGERPAKLVQDLIAGDSRFFEPIDPTAEEGEAGSDHNYNDNQTLNDAIRSGMRGAYWHILHQLR
jgi:radical SAM superfamily enzyme YgiQ (UPF0313 family)